MYLDSLNKSASLIFALDTLGLQFVGSHDNKVQGGHISQVEVQKDKDTFNLSSLF